MPAAAGLVAAGVLPGRQRRPRERRAGAAVHSPRVPMRRRALLLVSIPIACGLVVWLLMSAPDTRPNPILVTEVGAARASGPLAPSPAAPAGPARHAQVDVEVARERPVPMRVSAMPVVEGPEGPIDTIPDADPDAVAAESRELRAALDAWIAADPRRLRIEATWESTHFEGSLFGTPQAARVVLHARLAPAPPAGK